MAKRTKAPAKEPVRVSTIELFFDLVFVFTLTQLTQLVEKAQGPLDLFSAFLVLILVWWIYAGYAWLTNATGASGGMRFVLLTAMAGFLVMALAIPSLFNQGGPLFGLAYLFVVLLHLGTFAYYGGRPSWPALLGLLPINGGAAALAIAAGLAPLTWRWAFLLAGASMFILSTLLRNERGFSVEPEHFAERHGLVILIALGESVIDLGTGAGGQALSLANATAAVLSLGLVAGLWWAYFAGGDSRAEAQLVAASPAQRSRMALLGYWYAHLVMIAGIVVVATGLKRAMAWQGAAAASAVGLLVGGVAAYAAGIVLFRRIMGAKP